MRDSYSASFPSAFDLGYALQFNLRRALGGHRVKLYLSFP